MISSVEVDDLDIVRVPGPPTDADPPLVIDANAALSGTITKQLFEAIARAILPGRLRRSRFGSTATPGM